MDVAVIGGGVVGLACARDLVRAGATVTVLEALPVTAQASTARANGGIRAQFGTAPNIACSMVSIEAYETLHRLYPRVGLHQTGYLLVTGTAEGERALRASFERQRALGVTTKWLDAAAVAEKAPQIRTEGVRAATFHQRDGFLDPAGAAAALQADALKDGATILTSAAVTAARGADGGWRLTTARGEIRSEIVVNAAGADARSVAALLGGTDLPVEPIRRNLALFHDDPAALTPMLVDLDTGVLARREVGGGWVVGYADPTDPPGRQTDVDPRFLEALAAHAPNRFPFLADLPVDPARCWSGLYPETPDHHAVIGRDPAAVGVLIAAGFGGHGVMHAPAAGRAIAELATTGRSETIDLRPLRIERFAEDDLIVEPNVF